MRITRRRLLGAAAVAAVAPFAGCGCETFPGIDVLPSASTRVGRVDGAWVVDGSVAAEFVNIEGTVEGVTAVVSDEAGTELARRDLGSFRSEDAREVDERCVGDTLTRELRLELSAYPYRIGLRSPALEACDEDVSLYAAVFNDYYDPGHAGTLDEYWRYEPMGCPGSATGTPDGPGNGGSDVTGTPGAGDDGTNATGTAGNGTNATATPHATVDRSGGR